MLDTFSDSLLNAFSKIKNPDERFVNMKEQLDKLEENLTLIEKTLNRTNKRQEGKMACIHDSYDEAGNNCEADTCSYRTLPGLQGIR